MVHLVASQALAAISAMQPTTEDQVQAKQAATEVLAAEKSDTQQQTHSWPKRKPLGELIEPQKSSLDAALEQLNNNLKAWATGVRFDVDPDSQRLVISLVDNETGEVIRAVPSEAVLQISRMIAQFQGNSINTKA